MKIVSTIVCDDIRREINGKDILIGVYSGDIAVPQVPFQLQLAFWVEVSGDAGESEDLAFRLTYAGELLAKFKLHTETTTTGFAALPLSGMQLVSDKLGDLVMEYSSDEESWIEIKRKSVLQAPVPQTTPWSPSPPVSHR
jgi:hypothetical protein